MKRNSILLRIIRRKERRLKELKEHSADNSSIGDMAFLLLIFFIVTGSFMVRQGIMLSLPSKSAGSVRVKENQIIEIYPQNDGFLYNRKLLKRDEISKILKEKRKERDDSIVLIMMKDDVRYERLVETLSLIKVNGIKKVSLKNVDRES